MADTEKLLGELRAIFTEITEIDEIPSDKSLKDLGVDSMMALELVTATEKKYPLNIDESDLHHVATLDKAAELVAKKLG